MQLTPPANLRAPAPPLKPASGRRILLLLALSCSWVLGGCALWQPRADPTRFFVLNAPTASDSRETDHHSRRWRLGLRPLEGPAYLRSKAIVARIGQNELRFADYDRWAEPLDQGISRVLKETLGSARNVESVALNSRGEAALDYEVLVRVQACEGVRAGTGGTSVHFAATWELRSLEEHPMTTVRGRFTPDPVAWDGSDYGQLAARLGEAIAGLGRIIAASLPTEAAPPHTANSKLTQP